MKITIIILTTCLLQVSASSFAQKMTLSKRVVSVGFLFKEIRKQTGYNVLWQSATIDESRKLEVSFNDTALESALQQILVGQNLSYTIKKNTVVIKTLEQSPVQSQVQQVATRISGMVREKTTGEVIPGVSVKITGSRFNGSTSTSTKGSYVFTSIPAGSYRLNFYYVGYLRQSKDITIAEGEQLNLDVILAEDNVSLKAVEIKTGYQTIKKERATGAVETLLAKDIADKGFTSVEEAIKGRMPGVIVANISGKPGAQAQIRVRGINSLTGDMNPIWIVDGMPLQGDSPSIGLGGTDLQNSVLSSGIGNIPPDDIESITVLKDAAATAIYGSRAANGVIVITTKRGKAGRSVINYQASYSIDEAPKSKLQMMTSQQKVDFETSLYNDFPHINSDGRIYKLLGDVDRGIIKRADAAVELDRLKNINTNWYNEIFKNAHSQNHVISLSGGSENTQYYASFNYLSQEGVMPNNKFSRMGGNLKLTHDFNTRLRVFFDIYANLRDERTTASNQDPLQYATYANPYERLRNDDGSYAYDRSYYPQLSALKNDYRFDFNIMEDLNRNTFTGKNISNQMSLKLEYKLISSLMFATQGTFSNTSAHGRKVLDPGSFSSKQSAWLNSIYTPEREITDNQNNGSLNETTSRSQSYTWRNQLQYAQNFNEKHFVSAIAGQEMSDEKSYAFRYYSPEFDPVYGLTGFPDLTGVDASRLSMAGLNSTSEQQRRSVSFFSTASYSYMDKYIASGSYRLDGVDIVGTNNRFTPLWNLSFKYNLHNEDYLKALTFINTLAIRGSYGFTGSIDRNAYPFTLLRFNSTSYRYEGEKIPSTVVPGNPSIKWQRKEDRSIGLDFSLFNYKVNGTINYYNNDTRDLLDRTRLAVSTGRDVVSANVASLKNTGWEFSLSTVNLDINKFRWTTSFNIAINRNTVTETFNKKITDLPQVGFTQSNQRLFVQDQPANAWYGYEFAGVDPGSGHTLVYVDAKDADGKPIGHPYGDGRYVLDMDTEFSNQALKYLGESYPPVTGGFGTAFNLGRFSLSAQFMFMTGHKINSFISSNGAPFAAARLNQLASAQFRWREVGDVTTVPAYAVSSTANFTYFLSSRLESGNFLKLNNVSLGYNMPQSLLSKFRLSSARINFNIQNLYTFTRYRGIDPETMGAFGYPSARKFNMSLNLGI